ncbi:DUF4222 domain-containing protein [Pectobacterium versatile]|uniref:DUF4222 domain-containing protein n=1 Tax=Pectobacterium versatile TaxID=2488639 RepID=UPI0037FF560D
MRNPEPNDQYKDKRGQPVTVQSVEFNRVTFTRHGYPAPCVMPFTRFTTEFTYCVTGENNAEH